MFYFFINLDNVYYYFSFTFSCVFLQVSRHEALSVGVTYESEFDCDIFNTGGINYTWTLFDSMGKIIPLPQIEKHRQTLTLPKHFLHYDTYTAVAKVRAKQIFPNRVSIFTNNVYFEGAGRRQCGL